MTHAMPSADNVNSTVAGRVPSPRALNAVYGPMRCLAILFLIAASVSAVVGEEQVEIISTIAVSDEEDRPLDRLPKPPAEAGSQVMAIDWPAVLELAQASGLEIKIADEKVHEANVNLALARQHWLPSLKLGSTWLHHDGRIQDIPGNLLDTSKGTAFVGGLASLTIDPRESAVQVLKAKQGVFAQSGQLDRVTRETLQEASQAYIDLTAAQAGASISMEIAKLIEELVARVTVLRERNTATEAQVLQTQIQKQSQQQIMEIARQNQLAASAKLAMILDLESGVTLVAADDWLVPVTLVDDNRPVEDLIAQAREQGPGLAEAIALISAFEQQQKQQRWITMSPTFSIDVGTGEFGGGFGGHYSQFSPRADIGVSMYWDLFRFVGTSKKRELFESKRRQAMLTHDQVLRKLEAGVVVASNGAKKARTRIMLAEDEIDSAIKTYKLLHDGLQPGVSTPQEVITSIGMLGKAYQNYLAAVIDFNRFQIQLQYLIGFEAPGHDQKKDDADEKAEPAPEPRPKGHARAEKDVVRRPVPLQSPSEEWKSRRRHPKDAYARALRHDRYGDEPMRPIEMPIANADDEQPVTLPVRAQETVKEAPAEEQSSFLTRFYRGVKGVVIGRRPQSDRPIAR